MKWEDFKDATLKNMESIDFSEWKKTNIECPNCGILIYKNVRYVLACYPPKYKYKCLKCGWTDTWF